MKKDWVTRRVVVQVPVFGGGYNEKDLRRDVARLVSGSQLNRLNQMSGSTALHRFGKVEVKEYARGGALKKEATLEARVMALEARQRSRDEEERRHAEDSR